MPEFQRNVVNFCLRSSFPVAGRWLALATFALISLNVGCARYHLGNQFLYRSDIRTVHVMMFESDSYRRFIGQRLTEAVIKEIEVNTPLTITDPQIADSFIRGRLIRDSKVVVGENVDDEPRAILVGWLAEVDWVDRAGVPLMERQLVRIRQDAVFVPEGGQSMATTQQKIIELMARDVVSQMQTAW
jgi:hypothetical protein